MRGSVCVVVHSAEAFLPEGVSEYTTCANLLTTSSNTWPKSAVFQIAANGVPLSKIVIGKPATASDANNGFMSTSTLASCLQQAKNQGWSKLKAATSISDTDEFTTTQTAEPWSGR